MEGVNTKPLYEVGYHLISSITEDAVGAEVARVREAIESRDGSVVSEEWPKTMQLAYSISRKEQSGTTHYDTAHFGWLRFEIEREKIQEIQKDLDALGAMLRFILVEVPRVKAMSKKRRTKSVFHRTKSEGADTPVADGTSEEIDREIEKLVSE